MMASKCGLCQKAVYPNDSHLNLDSQQYHTGCAKCADCRCQITLSNFCKSGNLLLCKTHYYERFSVKGSYAGSEKYKKASTANSAPVVPVGIAPASSSSSARNEPLSERAASVKDRLKQFGAGVSELNKCAVCGKSVYPNDPQLAVDGLKYHTGCAKCADCKCQITTSNFTRDDKTLYCKTHYIKRFKEQGKFVGEEKFSQKRGETKAEYLAGHTIMSSSTPPAPPSESEEIANEEAAAKQKAEEEEAAAAKQKAEEEEAAAAKQKAEEEEAAAKQKAEEEEAAAKQKAEEEEAAAKQKAEEEEAAAKQKAEEEEAAAKQKAEEEEAAAKQKAEEEEAAAKQKAEEEEAAAKQKAEEEEAAAKQKAEEEGTESGANQEAEEDNLKHATNEAEIDQQQSEEENAKDEDKDDVSADNDNESV